LDDDGKFYVEQEYPDEAWQEAIVNACAHRSYSLRGANIFVRIFDDRFVVDSPGGFPPFVNPENIYQTPHRRNWWLMEGLYFMKWVLCENEGTKRMRRAMSERHLPDPIFEQKEVGSAIVRVTLRNDLQLRTRWVDSDVVHLIGAAKASKLTDFEKRLVNFAAEYGRINVSQAMKLMPKPRWHNARKILEKLVDVDGVFLRHRRFKRDSKAYYELIKIDHP
jgi:ATP-dependent DNA helicase RecG